MPQSRKQEMPDASRKRYTLEQLAAMPAVERANYLEANPEEYHRMLGESLVKGLNAKALQDNPD